MRPNSISREFWRTLMCWYYFVLLSKFLIFLFSYCAIFAALLHFNSSDKHKANNYEKKNLVAITINHTAFLVVLYRRRWQMGAHEMER